MEPHNDRPFPAAAVRPGCGDRDGLDCLGDGEMTGYQSEYVYEVYIHEERDWPINDLIAEARDCLAAAKGHKPIKACLKRLRKLLKKRYLGVETISGLMAVKCHTPSDLLKTSLNTWTAP